MHVNDFIANVQEIALQNGTHVLPKYEDIQLYRNDDVIEKFIDEFKVTKEEASEIFSETLKFLYFAHIGHSIGQNAIITESTLIIDKMWHVFILFTKEYTNFCEKYFGRYLHHQPNTKSLVESRRALTGEEQERRVCEIGIRLETQLKNIAKFLGEETIRKWYFDFETRYSIDQLNSLVRAIPCTINITQISTPDQLGLSEMIQEIVIRDTPRVTIRMSCGCSGTGCGAGCSCNSGSTYS